MLGLTGQNDLRDIEERQAQGDAQAQLALDMVAYRLKKYIGAYTAVLGRVDAFVFTAGVGEHSDTVRQALLCRPGKSGHYPRSAEEPGRPKRRSNRNPDPRQPGQSVDYSDE